MHLSETKFKKDKVGTLTAYCGDFNPPQPRWSILRLGASDSEVGVYLYFEINGEIERIRYVLNDVDYSNDTIKSWQLYLYYADKKDFMGKTPVPKKMVILNDFNPEKIIEYA